MTHLRRPALAMGSSIRSRSYIPGWGFDPQSPCAIAPMKIALGSPPTERWAIPVHGEAGMGWRRWNVRCMFHLQHLNTHKNTWPKGLPTPHRIFKNAKFGDWRVEKLHEMLQRALDGRYHPRSNSRLEFDQATAIYYELGGDATLHSSSAFPYRTKASEDHRR